MYMSGTYLRLFRSHLSPRQVILRNELASKLQNLKTNKQKRLERYGYMMKLKVVFGRQGDLSGRSS